MQIIEILNPVQNYIPVVASIPHSGMYIPQEIARNCKKHHLKTLRNTDWFLDRLYDFLPDLGIHIIRTNCSRYVIDLNRPLTGPIFGRYQDCAVYRTNTWKEDIYDQYPTENDIRQRIKSYYIPYHRALKRILKKVQKDFGKAYLLDLHSFLGPIDNQICIGDFFGKSCSRKLFNTVYHSFKAGGYDVVANKIFSGGHITQHYSDLPLTETIQIEIRYSVYLKDTGFDLGIIPTPTGPEFENARANLRQVFSNIIKEI